jgi:hypothetical protein
MDKPNDRAVPLDNPEDVRRIEEALHSHGIDPARAIEQRDWSDQGDVLRTLIETAEQTLSPDEFRRLREEIERVGTGAAASGGGS